MGSEALFLFLSICGISLFTYRGLTNPYFQSKHLLDVEAVLAGKEYYRLLTSGFIHGDYLHLIFNIYSLYILGSVFETMLAPWLAVTLFLLSVIGGSLFTVWIHRNHEYRALGASGGVFGILYAHILLFPNASIHMLFLPIYLPAWLFGISVLLLSIVAMKAKYSCICHEGHFGGAFTGLVFIVILYPKVLSSSLNLYITFMAICLLFIYYCYTNPLFLPLKYIIRFDSFNKRKAMKTEQEKRTLDDLLFKISAEGMGALSSKEKKTLERLSKKYRNR